MLNNDEYLTPFEVATELRIDVNTVYRMMRGGELPHLNLGYKTKRISRIALDNYKKSKEVGSCN